MNSLIEFTELLKNRLSDLLFQEADNDKYIYLYLADGYWTAFEKSAYRLSRIYEPVMLLPMRLPSTPYPIVSASIKQDNLHTAINGLFCQKWSGRERIYLTGKEMNITAYQKWHDKETRALRTLHNGEMLLVNGTGGCLSS